MAPPSGSQSFLLMLFGVSLHSIFSKLGVVQVIGFKLNILHQITPWTVMDTALNTPQVQPRDFLNVQMYFTRKRKNQGGITLSPCKYAPFRHSQLSSISFRKKQDTSVPSPGTLPATPLPSPHRWLSVNAGFTGKNFILFSYRISQSGHY